MKNIPCFQPVQLLISVFITAIGFIFYPTVFSHKYYIGVLAGSALDYEGIKKYVNEINQSGGIFDSTIELVILNDKYDTDVALSNVKNLIKHPELLAVIGHTRSGLSTAISPLLQAAKIPTITAYATNDLFVNNNPWYFRTTFKDSTQAKVLAHYIQKVLKGEKVTIIQDNKVYGGLLAAQFKAQLDQLGIPVVRRDIIEMDLTPSAIKQQINDLILSLKEQPAEEYGHIFLSTHSESLAELVTHLRSNGILNPLILPDDASTEQFINTISTGPNGELLTRDLVLTSPYIFDVGNQRAQQFRQQYIHQYDKEPDYKTVIGYDTMGVIVEAITRGGVKPQFGNIANMRQQLKQALENINGLEVAYHGVAGPIYFDPQGNSNRFMYVGEIKQGKVVSTTTQFREMSYSHQLASIDNQQSSSKHFLLDDKQVYLAQVVYTGVVLNNIDQLDFAAGTFHASFHLWFRSHSRIDKEHIAFSNLDTDLDIQAVSDITSPQGYIYQLFKIKGRFKMDTLANLNTLKSRSLLIQFYHHQQDADHLMFVPDYMLNDFELMALYKNTRLLATKDDWEITQVQNFQDITDINSLGHIQYSAQSQSMVSHSRFNALIEINEASLQLFDLLTGMFVIFLLAASFIALCILITLIYLRYKRNQPLGLLLVFQYLFMLIFLFCLQAIIVEYHTYIPNVKVAYAIMALKAIQSLHWLASSFYLNQAVRYLIWDTLEKRTGQPIPIVMKRFVSLFIYGIGVVIVISVVFEKELTTLMATSGILAMVIGLAIQTNLANVFSGMALNFEKSFIIGDTIKIGEGNNKIVGCVENITWRSTKIRAPDGTLSSIPNRLIADSCITNLTVMPHHDYK